MVGNKQDLMNIYQQMRANPARFFGLPQNVDVQNPQGILQYLMNSGMVSQEQINRGMSQMQNPLLKQIFGAK